MQHRVIDHSRVRLQRKCPDCFLLMGRESNCTVGVFRIAAPGDKARYDAISAEILQQYSQNIRLIPRSTYRKAIGEGVRTITYGAHTSNAASGKSGKHVTLITESVNHHPTLTLCHRLATTMPKPFPYLSITVVLLTDGEELSPHKDVQNHRLHQNATISFGKWTGGVLQILEDEKWINL